MITQYLDNLENGLVEKSSLLSKLTELSEKQREVVTKDNIDWDEFDRLTDLKAEQVTKLDVLDEGFDSVYNRIKEELGNNKDKYKDRIQSLQKLISEVTEKSTSLMALEQRNKEVISLSFNKAKQKLNQSKVNSKVASNYYKAMSRVNFIDPQLMDKKK